MFPNSPLPQVPSQTIAAARANKGGQHDAHLQGVGERHRPHAADERVGNDNAGGHQDAHGQVHAEEGRLDARQRHVLGGDPAEVARHQNDAGNQLRSGTEGAPVEVGDGQKPHLPERLREEEPCYDECASGGEGIEDRATHTFKPRGFRRAEHCRRAEPRRQQRSPGQAQRQAPTRDSDRHYAHRAQQATRVIHA
jgi:hypothetical protein